MGAGWRAPPLPPSPQEAAQSNDPPPCRMRGGPVTGVDEAVEGVPVGLCSPLYSKHELFPTARLGGVRADRGEHAGLGWDLITWLGSLTSLCLELSWRCQCGLWLPKSLSSGAPCLSQAPTKPRPCVFPHTLPSPFFLSSSLALATLPSQSPATYSAGTGHEDTIKPQPPSRRTKGLVACRPDTLFTRLPPASVAPQ